MKEMLLLCDSKQMKSIDLVVPILNRQVKQNDCLLTVRKCFLVGQKVYDLVFIKESPLDDLALASRTVLIEHAGPKPRSTVARISGGTDIRHPALVSATRVSPVAMQTMKACVQRTK